MVQEIIYKLKDQAGNQTTVKIYIIPTEFVTITGPSTLDISAEELGYTDDMSQNWLENKLRAYLLSNAGITAKTYDNKNLTDQIEIVALNENGTLVYQVVFRVTDSQKHTATKQVLVKVIK